MQKKLVEIIQLWQYRSELFEIYVLHAFWIAERRPLNNGLLPKSKMKDIQETFTSSQKTLVYTAIGETVLIVGLPFVFLDRITLKSFLILLSISAVVLGIMYAIEWSKRTIKSIEFIDGKIIIIKSTTNYHDSFKQKIQIELKSITKCINEGKTSWRLEYDGNKTLKLNLYAFDSNDADKIVAKITHSMRR